MSTLIDDCVGYLDACGICNGSGSFYLEGTTIPCFPGNHQKSDSTDCIYGTADCLPCVMTIKLNASSETIIPIMLTPRQMNVVILIPLAVKIQQIT